MPQQDNQILVKVENLSKKYCKDLKTSLWYGMQDLVSILQGNKAERKLREKEFWAVKDISFELRRGECLGLIGHNGAGKSTLLKILNGLIKPDAGKVTIKGRVGALIELGAGFNGILTGRENIYNNGAVLGFTRKEINEKFEEIIDFAEIREFIDMPVQNYSSGMKVRLGFAIAAQMEPDVLLIDEVLAVGDIGFRMKCLTRIGELLRNTAVVFVSHSMPQVARIANKILLLRRGQELIGGMTVSAGIEKYFDEFKTPDHILTGKGKIKILKFEIFDHRKEIIGTGNEEVKIIFNQGYLFSLLLNIGEEKVFEIHYSFIDKESKIVAILYSYINSKSFKSCGITKIDVFIENISLGLGSYSLGLTIVEVNNNGGNGEVYYYNSKLATFKVTGVKAGVAPVQFSGKWHSKQNYG